MRSDLRSANELRALTSEVGLLQRCDGSCRLQSGATHVIAGVFGPVAPRFSRLERADAASIEVSYAVAEARDSRKSRGLEAALKRLLEAVVDLQAYPRMLISVSVEEASDDGSVLAAAVNAAVLALVDAGVAVKCMPAAVSCAVDESGEVLLDPTAAEEKASAAGMTVVCTTDSEHATSVLSAGCMDEESYLTCLDSCVKAAAVARSFMRKAMAHKVARDMQILT